MISLHGVTDTPGIFGAEQSLLLGVNLTIPQGRYALLSRKPEFHRAIIDVISGLRPPRVGFIAHSGLVSWPIGRQGFVRGKATGLRMIEFISSIYGMKPTPCVELVADLLTSPEYLPRPMENWPLYVRQEFSCALALAPDFDVYVTDGAIPFEPCRFTNLWLALFEERLVGRTLLLSTYRYQQMMDYCVKGLVYEQHDLRIDDNLERCIHHYPPRRSRSESLDVGEDSPVELFPGGGQFSI
jgi:capsular polysaccharide transport system ATP-binding protein